MRHNLYRACQYRPGRPPQPIGPTGTLAHALAYARALKYANAAAYGAYGIQRLGTPKRPEPGPYLPV